MRIVAGKHRGRRLVAPPGRSVRPTADRTRQALFNILEHGHFVAGGGSPVRGAHVLDAFAGTGAMGLEALSRGASHAVFMESAQQALEALRRNVAACREDDDSDILRVDATHPPRARTACTLAFLDPPYNSGLAAPCLSALAAGGWLADGALCTVELAADEAFLPPHAFSVLDERRYGAARVVVLRYGGGAIRRG
ncbi:MAG: 16S rRNA (guanine(966)-N(2))-methyltransferase RsmD [Alphaproteobacteria bacterium]|nr:16S rRNA (guanine(966)-N(2))-methyltransferase RsmD [Alphaproteobacteria bacterium]